MATILSSGALKNQYISLSFENLHVQYLTSICRYSLCVQTLGLYNGNFIVWGQAIDIFHLNTDDEFNTSKKSQTQGPTTLSIIHPLPETVTRAIMLQKKPIHQSPNVSTVMESQYCHNSKLLGKALCLYRSPFPSRHRETIFLPLHCSGWWQDHIASTDTSDFQRSSCQCQNLQLHCLSLGRPQISSLPNIMQEASDRVEEERSAEKARGAVERRPLCLADRKAKSSVSCWYARQGCQTSSLCS